MVRKRRLNILRLLASDSCSVIINKDTLLGEGASELSFGQHEFMLLACNC